MRQNNCPDKGILQHDFEIVDIFTYMSRHTLYKPFMGRPLRSAVLVRACVYVCVCMYVCVCVCVYVFMRVCMYVFVCTLFHDARSINNSEQVAPNGRVISS